MYYNLSFSKLSLPFLSSLALTLFRPGFFFASCDLVGGGGKDFRGSSSITSKPLMPMSSVEAARKVFPNWFQETMTCHSFLVLSVVRIRHHW